jgi:hypothetical protein
MPPLRIARGSLARPGPRRALERQPGFTDGIGPVDEADEPPARTSSQIGPGSGLTSAVTTNA